MTARFENLVHRIQRWCEGQAHREAPYMPATALGTAIGFPIMTAFQQSLDQTPRDSPWPFCLLLTGVFLHLAIGWGFEYKSRWRYNGLIGRVAVFGCVAFWLAVILYSLK
jgi:hypothetical protein